MVKQENVYGNNFDFHLEEICTTKTIYFDAKYLNLIIH
jgi:hypothetical protein